MYSSFLVLWNSGRIVITHVTLTRIQHSTVFLGCKSKIFILKNMCVLWVYVCICMSVCFYMSVSDCVYLCMSVLCLSVSIWVLFLCFYVHVCWYVSACVYLYVSLCCDSVYVCMYVCMCMSICYMSLCVCFYVWQMSLPEWMWMYVSVCVCGMWVYVCVCAHARTSAWSCEWSGKEARRGFQILWSCPIGMLVIEYVITDEMDFIWA